jgi:hypothetical protein
VYTLAFCSTNDWARAEAGRAEARRKATHAAVDRQRIFERLFDMGILEW